MRGVKTVRNKKTFCKLAFYCSFLPLICICVTVKRITAAGKSDLKRPNRVCLVANGGGWARLCGWLTRKWCFLVAGDSLELPPAFLKAGLLPNCEKVMLFPIYKARHQLWASVLWFPPAFRHRGWCWLTRSTCAAALLMGFFSRTSCIKRLMEAF